MERAKKAAAPADDIADPALQAVVASAVELIPLGRLRRAPENVRKTAIDVDVAGLADDIAAKGVLQNLIGYAGDTDIDHAVVYIVGGGRRLQALDLLRQGGRIDDAFAVPVLLRPADEAVELSLSENLQKRDMNPADEFTAFQALMKPGTLSPADLAKRFGFSERYVKQRLRLADLADEILDAVREGKVGLEGALAYARSQDHRLQLKVFSAQCKSSWKPHDAASIQQAYIGMQMTTADPLFKYVGEKKYLEQGGAFEDDLFGSAEIYGGIKVRHAEIVRTCALVQAEFQIKRLATDAKKACPAFADVLLSPDLRGKMPKAPKGYKTFQRDWNSPSWEDMRAIAERNGIAIIGIAKVGHDGTLALAPEFLIPADEEAVFRPKRNDGPTETPEERAARLRRDDIRSYAAILAVRALSDAGTAGRRFFTSTKPWLGRKEQLDGVGEVYAIGQTYYVTPSEVDAHFAEAEAGYDERIHQQEEARIAREKERADAMAAIAAIDGDPAVILVAEYADDDPIPAFLQDDGSYVLGSPNASEDGDAYADLEFMLECVAHVAGAWASVAAWEAWQAEDGAAAVQSEDVEVVQ